MKKNSYPYALFDDGDAGVCVCVHEWMTDDDDDGDDYDTYKYIIIKKENIEAKAIYINIRNGKWMISYFLIWRI